MSDENSTPKDDSSAIKLGILTDIGSVADATKSIVDMVSGILERNDRDAPDKEHQERMVYLQNAFASNALDSDDFRRWLDRLLNRAGSSITPTSDPRVGRRELLHALLLNTINLIRERQYATRAFAALANRIK